MKVIFLYRPICLEQSVSEHSATLFLLPHSELPSKPTCLKTVSNQSVSSTTIPVTITCELFHACVCLVVSVLLRLCYKCHCKVLCAPTLWKLGAVQIFFYYYIALCQCCHYYCYYYSRSRLLQLLFIFVLCDNIQWEVQLDSPFQLFLTVWLLLIVWLSMVW